MKTRLIISAIVWLTIAAFYISNSSSSEPNKETALRSSSPPGSSSSSGSNNIPFLIGSIENGAYKDFYGYSKASMNLWHTYSQYDRSNGRVKPIGWVDLGAIHDLLLNDILTYKNEVLGILENNASNGMYSYMMRPKIEYLCYGQKSDYQCEPLYESNDPSDLNDWFYSYDTHETGEPVNDGQNTPVMFCGLNESGHSSGYVVKGLKTNRELCNRIVTNLTQDNVFDWYILPKIKVPANIANETRVCRIEIINWENDIIKTFELNGESFKDENTYSGNYLSEYNYIPGNPGYHPLLLPLSESLQINPNEHAWTNVSIDSHFDIRVFWYKECDMWIDYVRIENEIAYDLFKGTHDNWIEAEAQQIGGYAAGNPYKFYIEEVEYNNLPCIKYVNEKIKQYQPNMSVVCVPYLCVPPMNGRWKNFGYEKIKQVYDATGLREFYMSYYPLHGNYNSQNIYGLPSYIPNTFSNCNYDLPNGKLGVPVPTYLYEENLQYLFDIPDGLFIKNGLKTANRMSKDLNIPFIFLEQAHLWLNPSTVDNEGYSQREPTDEELEVMGCIAISYGAKGISYFAYDSWNLFNHPDTNGKYSYARGLTDINASSPPRDTSKRYCNVYGQNKWGKIVELNKKYSKWGRHIMDFDCTNNNSYIFHNATERNNLYFNTFLKSIRTSTGSGSSQCNENITFEGYDSPNTTYLQAATFTKTNPEYQNEKYFMIVNRRCSPDLSGENCSGKRIIEIALDSTGTQKFDNFNNWKIIDLKNDSTIITFDKRYSTPISLGNFQPGEGKLFKIAPVMQEGGSFVCDEEVENTAYICKGLVNTNGFNLTLNNVTASFKSNCGINVNGGNLVLDCGIYQGNGSEQWNGFYINQSGSYDIGGITIKNINNFAAFDIVNSPSGNFFANTFDLSSGSIPTVNAVRINNTGLNPNNYETPSVLFYLNTVNLSNSGIALSVVYSADAMGTAHILENIFNSSGQEGIAILLSSNTSSVIEANTITNFRRELH